MNDTACPVSIPGFTYNGDCNLLCKPTAWKDVLTFFLGNYGAHVATVIPRPGQSRLTTAFGLALALLFPGAGVLTGVSAIASLALFAPTELTKAARAGALCIVVKAGGDSDAADVEAVSQHTSTAEPDNVAQDSGPEKPGLPRISSNQVRHDAPLEEKREAPDSEHRRSVETAQPHAPTRADARRQADGQPDAPSRADARPQADGQPQAIIPRQSIPRDPGEKTTTLDGKPDEVLPASIAASQVHGIARLPAGYRLLVLPKWTSFEHDQDEDLNDQSATSFASRTWAWTKTWASSSFKSQKTLSSTVPCSYNAVKACISLGQLLFSVVTLYETRGNQLAVFGYAAFGLTAAPYFWMSLINLLGNLMCPQYPNIFIINSPTLDQLRKEVESKRLADRYPFDGTVGRISEKTEAAIVDASSHALKQTTALQVFFSRLDTETGSEAWPLALLAIAAYFVAAVPIAIVGGLSGFQPGQSAAYQRVWTMMWLCLGPMVGIGYGMWVLPLFESSPVLWRSLIIHKSSKLSQDTAAMGQDEKAGGQEADQKGSSPPGGMLPGGTTETRLRSTPGFIFWMSVSRFALAALFVSAYAAPAIGGFVVVGQMLMQYGTCSKIN